MICKRHLTFKWNCSKINSKFSWIAEDLHHQIAKENVESVWCIRYSSFTFNFYQLPRRLFFFSLHLGAFGLCLCHRPVEVFLIEQWGTEESRKGFFCLLWWLCNWFLNVATIQMWIIFIFKVVFLDSVQYSIIVFISKVCPNQVVLSVLLTFK